MINAIRPPWAWIRQQLAARAEHPDVSYWMQDGALPTVGDPAHALPAYMWVEVEADCACEQAIARKAYRLDWGRAVNAIMADPPTYAKLLAVCSATQGDRWIQLAAFGEVLYV